jgi:hypothetical protein
MKKVLFLLVCALVGALNPVSAQLRTPSPSPTCKFSQEVGLTKVEVEYSRPSAKGRKIFGELVRFGEMWRTGANASTKVSFADDITVGGKTLPKGTYALYTIPNEKSWTVIFYKNTTFGGVPGDKYTEDDVAAKLEVVPQKLTEKVETFTINLNNTTNNGGDLDLTWENTKVAIPFTVPTESKVLADIKTQMEGPSANTYYQAARYYLEEKKDMKQALEWINTALSKGGDRFWIMRTKALIQAELGMYKDAIATAEASTELAKKEGNKDYPAMNDASIKEWKKK